MYDQVMPFFYNGNSGTFIGTEGAEISYVKLENPYEKGAFVILHGKSENKYEYAELAYELFNAGYSCYLMDMICHGDSGKLSGEQKVHVNDFNNYVTDLEIFINNYVMSIHHEKLFIIGHSTGGLVATLYLEKKPDVVDGAVLVSPLFKIKAPMPESIALGIAKSSVALGKGEDYAFGQSAYDYYGKETGEERNNRFLEVDFYTHSYKRWLFEYDFYVENQDLPAGGGTWKWMEQAIAYSKKARSKYEAKKITAPIIIFEAGQDEYVDIKANETFVKNAENTTVLLKSHSQGYHELLFEVDEIRDSVVNDIIDFFKNN